MTEQDRKEFEVFMRDCECPPHKLSIVEGKYIWPLVADHFHTWLASRRTQDAKVRELVEAVENLEYAWENATYHEIEDTSIARSELFELLAQLKEQPNE